jgi:MFS family permease
MVFNVINSFLILFANIQGITENSGLFFTVYAATMLFTQPLVGKLTDRYGLVKVFIPSLMCSIISLFIISVSHTLVSFLLASFISAFGFGACQPAVMSLSMKTVSSERRGSASSTNFIGMDIGSLAGPIIAGGVAQTFGYVSMWRFMTIPLLIAIAVVFVFKSKITNIENSFING